MYAQTYARTALIVTSLSALVYTVGAPGKW